MHVTIKQIRAFIAVAQAKSFAEACELVHLSQPALSISIKKLEENIGGKLLVRSTRMLALSPEGAEFLPVAKRLLLDWDNALHDIHNIFSLNRGNLSISAMPSFASTKLPEHIMSYRQEYPGINIKIHDVIAEDAVLMVQEGKTELAICFNPGLYQDLIFTPLFSDEFVAAFPSDHELTTLKQLTWQSLSKYPFIALKPPSSIRHIIDSKLIELNLSLAVEFEANQLSTIAKMVATGLGISAVPSLYIGHMETLGLKCQAVTPIISRQVGIVTRRRYPLSQSAQAFVNMLQKKYTII